MSSDLVGQLRHIAALPSLSGWKVRPVVAEAADAIERLTKANVDWNELTLKIAMDEVERLRAALQSIAHNTCCEGCQEAAKWARAALDGGLNEKAKDSRRNDEVGDRGN